MTSLAWVLSDLGASFMERGRALKVWFVVLLVSLLAIAICINWLDTPVARLFLSNASRFSKFGIGGSVLVAGEVLLIAILAALRITRGFLPEFAKIIFVACAASLTAYIANDYILKFVFGRMSPWVLLYFTPHHAFNFFHGNERSSFPSGHMVLAAAFAAAIIRLRPRMFPGLAVLLGIGAIALVIGDWHFMADVIAGTFVGGTAGFVAGELWLEHVERHSVH
jgi:membrane-associated phospholipid phosphatase